MRSLSVVGEGERKKPLSLEEFVLRYSTQLPLQITVKKGYHGEDERHSIAAEDVYNVHFVKRTKIVILKDCRGSTYNIALNSAVQFSPLYNPNGNHREALQGVTFERVSDIMSQRTLPRIVRALKPHIRVDPMTTIEQFELFIVLSVVFSGVRRKMLKVYSVTCSQHKLLSSDSIGAFTTDPRQTYLYPPEILEHFLSEFPLEVKVVMNDGDFSEEIPRHLTNEVSTLTDVDSETSLIASTNWGRNDQVTDEDQMPLDIPVDIPIEVVVQPSDGERESDLSTHTKRLYEMFDPSQIRPLRSRHLRRGFEMEGMELECPERIYDIPDVHPSRSSPHQTSAARDRESAAVKPRSVQAVSPRLRPRLDTPKSAQDSANTGYSQPYQPSVSLTPPPARKAEHAAPDMPPQQERSPHKTHSQRPSAATATSSSVGPATVRERRLSSASDGGDSKRELELMGARVDILEREVYALRSEIGRLKTQSIFYNNHTVVCVIIDCNRGRVVNTDYYNILPNVQFTIPLFVVSSASTTTSGLYSVDDKRSSADRKNNIEYLKTLSTKQVYTYNENYG